MKRLAVSRGRILFVVMPSFLAGLCQSNSSVAGCFPAFNSDVFTAGSKRPIAVRDGIKMVRLADDEYFFGRSSKGRVAKFSPDGKKFVIVLQKGNLEKNSNEFSIYLFVAKDALRSPMPVLLARFSSSSNREGISNVKWLDDNETLVFLGENGGEVAQVYTVNIRTRRRTKQTSHSTPITAFNVTAYGRSLSFLAEPTQAMFVSGEEVRRNGITITSQDLADIISGGQNEHTEEDQLFLQLDNELPRQIVLDDSLVGNVPSLSPDGRFVCVEVWVHEVPITCLEYSNEKIQPYVKQATFGRSHSRLRRFMLLDTASGALLPLLDAPLEI